MIIITAKFRVRPEDADRWPDLAGSLTGGTRTEPGNLWFDWSRSLDDPAVYILSEGYRNDDALRDHLKSDHFQQARHDLPPHLAETVEIVQADSPQAGWTPLEELAVSR